MAEKKKTNSERIEILEKRIADIDARTEALNIAMVCVGAASGAKLNRAKRMGSKEYVDYAKNVLQPMVAHGNTLIHELIEEAKDDNQSE